MKEKIVIECVMENVENISDKELISYINGGDGYFPAIFTTIKIISRESAIKRRLTDDYQFISIDSGPIIKIKEDETKGTSK